MYITGKKFRCGYKVPLGLTSGTRPCALTFRNFCKGKYDKIKVLKHFLLCCLLYACEALAMLKGEALKELRNGNGNCTILNGKKWDLK